MLHSFPGLAGLDVQSPTRARPTSQHTASSVEVQSTSRVLIVDDHSLFRRVVREVLDEHPQLSIVGEAATGTSALTMVLELQPDIIVLDLQLPDTDGITMTQQVLQILPEARIVILGIAATEEMIIEAVRAGAFGFLTKDIEPEALARAIVGVADGQIAMSRQMAARALFYFQRTSMSERSTIAELTEREVEVIHLLAEGATDRQIAARLVIAESTAKKHVQHILRKLRARNRADAIVKYRQAERALLR